MQSPFTNKLLTESWLRARDKVQKESVQKESVIESNVTTQKIQNSIEVIETPVYEEEGEEVGIRCHLCDCNLCSLTGKSEIILYIDDKETCEDCYNL